MPALRTEAYVPRLAPLIARGMPFRRGELPLLDAMSSAPTADLSARVVAEPGQTPDQSGSPFR